ncbi:MAG: type IV toxin-antitoxin system AbiEi family antitoxin domain-containing protein, partial [Bacillota bacterium]|nr:type IV toxin-antitoxin system AbiEi family antitoxin domain-containing protein [Bacillota bacterium]
VQLDKLIENKKGLITTKDVENAGVPRQYLTMYVRENKLSRVSHGVYLTEEAFEDEMYVVQVKSKRIVFSHETALYMHELTDRDPLELSVTVPRGYNSLTLKEQGIKVYSIKKELHLMGTMRMITIYGREVIVYDKERTICDILKNRNNMDVGMLNEAIKRYVENKEKNIPLLLRYAKELGVQNIVRQYMEILL